MGRSARVGRFVDHHTVEALLGGPGREIQHLAERTRQPGQQGGARARRGSDAENHATLRRGELVHLGGRAERQDRVDAGLVETRDERLERRLVDRSSRRERRHGHRGDAGQPLLQF